MRVEQRIGRIDRIGQRYSTVKNPQLLLRRHGRGKSLQETARSHQCLRHRSR